MNTIGVSGKVKRIRNNVRVHVALCDMRGGLQGRWVPNEGERAFAFVTHIE